LIALSGLRIRAWRLSNLRKQKKMNRTQTSIKRRQVSVCSSISLIRNFDRFSAASVGRSMTRVVT